MGLLRSVLVSAVGVGLSASVGLAQEADWPSETVSIVVPYPAGGTTDILARAIASKLSEYHDSPFVVENRPGAGGNVGAGFVADADPDGHTLLVSAPGPLTSNDELYSSIPYDIETAFQPISQLAEVPIILVAHPDRPYDDVSALIEAAKAEPGQIAFGSQGIGTTSHLTMELLQERAGIEMVHVPYRGSAPAVIDLIGGQIDVMFDNAPTVLPQVEAGAMKPLAVAGSERLDAIPDVPTISESGVDVVSSAWFGLVAPAGTPDDVVAEIAEGVQRALAEPDVQEQFRQLGTQLIGSTPSEFSDFMQSERVKWTEVIEAAGMQIE